MRRRTSGSIAAARPTARGAARYAATAVGVLALGLALSACGIRDTTIPVDAGEGASRTACPPTPGVSSAQSGPGAFPGPDFDGEGGRPGPAGPSVARTGAPTATSSAGPSAAQPTTSNGILSCLLPTATPVPTGTPGAATATP